MKFLKNAFWGILILTGIATLVTVPFTNRKNHVQVANIDLTGLVKEANCDPEMFKWAVFAICLFFLFAVLAQIGKAVSN